MQRLALLAATVFVGSVGLSSAHAQSDSFSGPQGEDDYYEPEETYDDQQVPYDDSYDETDSYDDSQGEPYEEPPDGYDDSVAYDDQPAYDDQGGGYDDTSVDTFYDSLSPYGRWVRNPTYGLIWVPSRSVVGARFTPYSTNGQWVYTNSGWMFQSNWNWGWAPFHYGRWFREPGYGWVWVPGSTWAPAWVDWRFGGGVVGWAPLPPRHHRTVWVFANAYDLNRRDIHRYVIRNPGRYYRVTQPVRYRVRSGRSYWFAGPRGATFERAARFKVRPIRVRPPRAGIVARVRVSGGRVRAERVARPRSRHITQSRRDIPARTRRPDARRPDSRRPDPRVNRPDARDRRPEVRDRQPTPRREIRDQPSQRQAPDRRQPDRQRQAPDRRPEVRDRPQPSQRQAPDRQRPEPRERQPSQRQAPDRQRPEARERPQPRQRQAPDRQRNESRERPEKKDSDRRPARNHR